jgi:hypothetical protein
MEMDDLTRARVRSIQLRIDAALREPVDEASRSSFSSYMPGASTDLQSTLWTKSATGGIGDVEEILDRYEQLKGTDDPVRLRYALYAVLTNHPTVDALGLKLPSLEERSPWKVTPSNRQT